MGLPAGSETVIAIIFLLVCFVVLFIDAILAIAYLVHQPKVVAGETKPLFAPKWSLVDVWLGGQAAIVAITIAVIPIVIAVIAMMGGINSPNAIQSERFMIPITCLSLIPQNFILVMIPVLFITQKYKQRVESIGFRLKPERPEVVIGLISGLCVIVFSLCLEFVLLTIAHVILGDNTMKSVTNAGKKMGNESVIETSMASPIWGFIMLIGGAVLAPIGEEFFFRGFLFNALRRRINLPVAVCISALLFAVIHVAPLNVIVIFPMGIILALSYYYTGSLWVPIIIHMTNNGVQLVVLYIWNLTGHH
ncbi:MAG: CPBP family intramembrane glutamic endopeptidase [Chthonomonadales bacterium]